MRSKPAISLLFTLTAAAVLLLLCQRLATGQVPTLSPMPAKQEVALEPASWAGLSLAGQTAVYTFTLTNGLSTPAGFDLSTAGNAWSTTFWAAGSPITRTALLAPLVPFTLIVHVEVPAETTPGDDDTVRLWATATSTPTTVVSAALTTGAKGYGWIQAFGERLSSDLMAGGRVNLQMEQPSETTLVRIVEDDYHYRDVAVAAYHRDNAVIAWNSRGDIYYASVDRRGQPVVPATAVVTHTVVPHDAYISHREPVAAVAPTNGNVLIAWEREYEEYSEYIYDVYYTVRDKSGGEILPVTALTSGNWYSGDFSPSVAAFPGGRFAVTWIDWWRPDDEDETWVMFALLDNQGQVLTKHALTTQGYYATATANQLADGNVLVTWTGYAYWDGGPWAVRYAVLDSEGQIVHPITQLTDLPRGQDAVDAVGLANGNTLVAWHQPDANGKHQVYYTLLDSNYARVMPDQWLSNPWNDVNNYVSLARDVKDNAVLTWWAYTSDHNYYYAMVDHNGVLQTEPTILRTTPHEWAYTIRSGHASAALPLLGLTITKTAAPNPVLPGGSLTYTLSVENTGLVTATGVVITDVLPTHTTVATAGAGGLLVGDHVEWLSLTVPAGGALSVTWAVTVAPTLTEGAVIENVTYGCASAEGATATGMPITTTVATTGALRTYLPIVLKED